MIILIILIYRCVKHLLNPSHDCSLCCYYYAHGIVAATTHKQSPLCLQLEGQIERANKKVRNVN